MPKALQGLKPSDLGSLAATRCVDVMRVILWGKGTHRKLRAERSECREAGAAAQQTRQRCVCSEQARDVVAHQESEERKGGGEGVE